MQVKKGADVENLKYTMSIISGIIAPLNRAFTFTFYATLLHKDVIITHL